MQFRTLRYTARYDVWGQNVGYFDPGSGTWLGALVPFGGHTLATYPGSYWGTTMQFNNFNGLGSASMNTRYDGATNEPHLESALCSATNC